MLTPSKQAILHALKVGAHILVSIIIIGAAAYLENYQGAFSGYLTHFGIPAAIVNMMVAGVQRYLKEKAALKDVQY